MYLGSRERGCIRVVEGGGWIGGWMEKSDDMAVLVRG